MAILDSSTIKAELAKIVGDQHVSTDIVDLVAHERDDQFATVAPHLPDYVVRPGSKAEIRARRGPGDEHHRERQATSDIRLPGQPDRGMRARGRRARRAGHGPFGGLHRQP